jgi:ubiquinone/menaquinone biosynthesis C-methylase UbiE
MTNLIAQENLKESANIVSAPWETSTYYDDAERWTFLFWEEKHPFRRLFNHLDLSDALELACGHGRHAERTAQLTKNLTLVDVFESNLEFCRRRLQNYPHVQFIKNNGYSFQSIPSECMTSIYCYDSMVHFSPEIVQSYLNESARILKPRGMGLFHHSNYAAPLDRHYGQNPHARNHMTKDLFAYTAAKAGFKIVESVIIDWAGTENLDCISLIQLTETTRNI